MAKLTTYDVIVIGAGSAGFSAAQSARSLGASVCLVEHDRLGGECPNYACVPSKALLKTAAVYRQVQKARQFGVQVNGSQALFDEMMNYRQSVIRSLTGGGTFGARYEELLKDLGVEVKKGTATFVEQDLLDVAGETMRGKTFVIATGADEAVPPIPGLDQVKYLTWKQALQLSKLPKSMAIIGGGPVGCEIATFYATLGTRVVLLHQETHLLSREDREISLVARETLERLKVEVMTQAQVFELINAGSSVIGVHVDVGGNRKMHAVDQLVIATGKRAREDVLGLSEIGVKLTPHGYIHVSKTLQTNVPHVFAAGDVTGGMQFTHVAHHEGWIAGANAARSAKKLAAKSLTVQEQVVPRVTFLPLECASVGLTEDAARKEYKKLLIGRASLASLGRAATDQTGEGLLKLIVHPKTRKILGGHMIGERAGEVIHEVALAMSLGISVDRLARLIHAYPTYSELVVVAALSLQSE